MINDDAVGAPNEKMLSSKHRIHGTLDLELTAWKQVMISGLLGIMNEKNLHDLSTEHLSY